MNKYFIIFLLSLWRGQQAEIYSVIRRVNVKTDEYDNKILRVLPDRFKIPKSKCSPGNVSAQCTTKGGKRVGNTECKCECDGDKSTFGLLSNDWTCINNTKFHEFSGCSQRLDDRYITAPIITIPREEYDEGPDYLLPAISQSSNCVVTNASNLTCNGNWQLFSSDTVKEKFGVYQDDDLDPQWHLYNNGNLDIIKGQILRLHIGCLNPPPNQYCVIFKVKGNLQCPLPSTPSQPTTTTVSTISSTTQLQSGPPSSTPTTIATLISKTSVQTRTSQPTTWWSSILTQSVSSGPKPTFGYGSTTKTKESKTFTATTRPTTTMTKESKSFTTTTRPETTFAHGTTTRTKKSKPFTATTSFSSDKEKSTGKGKNNGGLIAGAVAGVIALVIIAIGFMMIMRRRKKQKPTKQRTDNATDNASYGRGVDNSLRLQGQDLPDEDEYSYAYNNVAPFVKTNKPEDLENHNKTNLEPERSVANLVYGQAEGLNQMASPSYNEAAPVYNTLEDAVYAKVDKSRKTRDSNPADAPIYNTLEEPDYAKLDRSPKAKPPVETQDESPYNVLERPSSKVLEKSFPEDAPVYDVLEGPESHEAPVYRALEGQDPRVYGALNMPNSQRPPEENRGYDDMVYDSVGDVINDKGDIYQELNQSGQRDLDVYQALNYPGNTMQLNEINQTHSNA